MSGTWAIAMEFGLGDGAYNHLAWHYFTDLSNLAAVLYFAVATAWAWPFLRRADDPAPLVKHTVTMALGVTFLVAHCMLTAVVLSYGDSFEPSRLGVGAVEAARLAILHYVVPLLAVGDWAFFEGKGRMGKFEPLGWMLGPLAYLAAVLLCVNVLGIPMGGGLISAGLYPYPFLDVDALGWPVVLGICAAMLVAFIGLGYAWRGLDAWLAARKRK